MMSGAALAEAIRSNMGFSLPVPPRLNGWGTAIVTHIQTSAIVTNAIGTVTGTAPPSGGALIDGAADNGTISGLSGSALATQISVDAGFGYVTGELVTFCNTIVSHIQSLGLVEFASGNIVGACSNTLGSPGSLTGTGSNGFVKNLNGTTLANALHSAMSFSGSTSTKLIQFCSALVNYIMSNAAVSYSSVTAICPSGGGAITDGQASNGAVA